MNVEGAAGAQATGGIQRDPLPREPLQVGMLKKTLESQQAEAAQLLKLLEGKGAKLDIRC